MVKRSNLSVEEKRALLKRLRAQKKGPLSFSQQRLWFIDQYEGGSSSYNLPFSLKMVGVLNRDALEHSLNRIVARHEILRTTFRTVGDEPHQRIESELKLTIPLVDIRHLEPDLRDKRVEELVQEYGAVVFDLTKLPLIEARLIQMEDDVHLLVVVVHHIVSDAWSFGLLVQETAALYTAHLKGEPDNLPKLSLQFAQYAARQRKGEADLAKQLEYWKEALHEAPTFLEVAADKVRPAVMSFRGRRQPVHINAALTEQLKDLSRRMRVTLYMTLLSGFGVLVSRHSGRQDFLIGSPNSNRNQKDVQNLIGFFVNTMVLRMDLTRQPDFPELCQRVRTMMRGAFANGEVPFEWLVRELSSQRQTDHHPLVQVVFAFQNVGETGLQLPGLHITPAEIHNETAKFDLLLALSETENGLEGYIEYNLDLFEPGRIVRLSNQLSKLFQSVVEDPSCRVGHLQLLPEEVRARLLTQWNNPVSEATPTQNLAALFEGWAQRTPDQIALVFKNRRLTYDQLNRLANSLSRRLIREGLQPGDWTPICINRSAELIVAVLAVLKAGSAYVPMDPDVPEQNQEYILDQIGARFMVTQKELAGRLGGGPVRLLFADEESDEPDHNFPNPMGMAAASSPAYMIYTSGSTGTPKGVVMGHHQVVRLFSASRARFNFDHRDIWTMFHSFAFDFSVWEIWGPLLNGARLVMVPYLTSRSPEAFYQLLAKEKVSVLSQTPGAFYHLMEICLNKEVLEHLHLVIFGGEALDIRVLEPWFRKYGDARPKLVNMYGITETCVHVTSYSVMEEDMNRYGSLIGVPLPDLQLYVLDERLEPQPEGVPGEMFVGGEGLAAGYLDRPDLTALAFIPNPFTNQSRPGARLYKSGDLARSRFLPVPRDGQNHGMEYLGRIDDQVKIRGFRIEMGGIREAFLCHPAIRETVITIYEDQHGHKQLGAYYGADADRITNEELKQHLAKRLPEYMTPAVLIRMDQLPLNKNGKVDRKALPDPRPDFSATYMAPRSPLEEMIAEIWAEQLGHDKVGVHQNFFELGGHSLLATRLVSRIRESHHVDIAVRDLFEAPTIAGLVEKMTKGREYDKSLQPLRPLPRTQDEQLPLSFSQQRLWFIDRMAQGNAPYQIDGAVRMDGPLDMAALRRALAAIVARHESLRTVFRDNNGEPYQLVLADAPLHMETVELGDLSEADQLREVRRRVEADRAVPFDLEQGPLLKVRLGRCTDTRHYLMIIMHHIISDAWSMGVFIREAATFYDAFVAGQEPNLPEPAVQYPDFARWQQRWQGGDYQDRLRAYWVQQLADLPELLDLPLDRSRPAAASFAGGLVRMRIPRETCDRLREMGNQIDASLYMVMLASFSTVLHRLTGAVDIPVGSPVANRNHLEIESLIGVFINTLVLRCRLDGVGSFRELLSDIRQMTLDAFTHQEMPFERLVEEMGARRDRSHSPLFQVLLNYQHQEKMVLKQADLKLEPVEVDVETAQFDLTLTASEDEQGIAACFGYRSELFDATTVQRLGQHLLDLLQVLPDRWEQPLDKLMTLSAADRQLLREWNRTAKSLPAACVHQLVSQQAAKTPEGVALLTEVDSPQTMSYQELDQTANALARQLIEAGAGPDQAVGVCLPRGRDAIVSLLAVLKSGAAYLPLDPAYPSEKLAHMISDSKTGLIITRSDQDLPSNQAKRLDLDQLPQPVAQEPQVAVDPQNLAYIIYTSGSTGLPKGVMINHANAVNLIMSFTAAYHTGAGDRQLHQASLSFDVSFGEIFPMLSSGGTVVIAKAGVGLDPTHFRAMLKRLQITIFGGTPSLLANFNRADQDLGQVRLILSGGEELASGDVDHLIKKTIVTNGYGPTETTVCATAAPCDGRDTRPHIGKPIINTRILMTDQRLRSTPVGAPGELCIAGNGLARGYLGDAARTAEKFVPDPHGDGGRLYKSGDLARFQGDGNIRFLGRIDHQVKLRGFRIELGEIEAVLSQHQAVSECAVVVREDTVKQLVGYVVLNSQDVGVEELSLFLRTKLPEYMTPAAMLVLEQMPLTVNDKTDRNALTHDSRYLPRYDLREHIAPRSDEEQALAQIWAELLGVEKVGVRDNFFELGGHSLLGTRVTALIRERMAIDLPVAVIFETLTIEALAKVLVQAGLDSGHRIEAVPRDSILPLSFSQQRIWFLEQFEEGKSTYNMASAIHLAGAFDSPKFQQALDVMVQRHESLRTVFANHADGPRQVIRNQTAVPVELIDLAQLDQAAFEREVLRQIEIEQTKAFDLVEGPLVRVRLLRQNELSHSLLLTMHHIISDGWSMGIFIRELVTIYAASVKGDAAVLQPLPIQYADFAFWQRNWLTGAVLESRLAYWKQQLAGIPDLLELPTDRPRPPVQTYNGGVENIPVSPAVAAELNRFSREQESTLFMTVLSAFAVLLNRYSREDDILIGTPSANRNHAGIQDLIGFFVNTLALRCDLSDYAELSFAALLKRIQHMSLEAQAQQDLPFEKLVEELCTTRSMSYSPLFQVMFNYQTWEENNLVVDGLDITPYSGTGEVALFDLTLSVSETPTGFQAEFGYNTDLFDRETIRGMAQHFSFLLTTLPSMPDQPMPQVAVLPQSERELLLEWNRTHQEYVNGTIHGLFESRVALDPDAIALIQDVGPQGPHRERTYRELNRNANGLAHLLKEQGIGADGVVAVFAERGIELVTGLLACMKAGAAYLPLDPQAPQEQITWVLADAGAQLILTQEHLVDRLPQVDRSVVMLTAAQPALAPPAVWVRPQNLAYIIYTSGSTGKPKGVMLHHSGALNLITSLLKEYRIGPGDRQLQQTSITFDVSFGEIFPILCAGGTSVIVTGRELLEPEAFHALLARQKITIFGGTPSLLTNFNQPGGLPAEVRLILSGGEALNTTHIHHLLKQAMVTNGYGPTEITVCATAAVCDESRERPPIGRPIINTGIHMLDRRGLSVPLGASGELCISGAGLARGYLGDPAKTAEKFVPNPFACSAQEAGSRLYCSGDLARFLADGQIQFMGRIDHQVKLRGFRIELGEIEAVLSSHECVAEAVVVVREDTQKQLVAHIVPHNPAPSQAELHEFLAAKLPEYMVPAAMLFLDRLPLTSNDKVDRRLLATDEAYQPDYQADDYVAPRTQDEQILAEIWAELLGLKRVGIRDDFFKLGGHSLLATRVISLIRERLEIDLPVVTIFETLTIEALAQALAKAALHKTPAIIPADRDGDLALSFAQQRLWFLDRLEDGKVSYNMSSAIRLKGQFQPSLLQRALDVMVSRHESLRTRFVEVDGNPCQIIAEPQPFPMQLLDLSGMEETGRNREVEARIAAEHVEPFDLSEGLLLRVDLLREAPDSHALLMTMHHIISDGWSMDIFIREMVTLYAGFCGNQAVELEPLAIQYADFAQWQRNWLSGAVLDAHLGYWRDQLAGAPDLLELPWDRPRPTMQTYVGDVVRIDIPAAASRALIDFSRAQGTTTFSCLLTIYALLLARYSRQDDILIGSPNANRNHAGIENLIGFFVNTLVLRCDLSERYHLSFAQLLERVHLMNLEAQRHQELPFEKLVEELCVTRDTSHSPLFQVMFNFQTVTDNVLAVDGLDIEPISADATTAAMFDLTLSAAETPAGLEAGFGYNTDLFDSSSIQQMAAHFVYLVEHLPAHCEVPLQRVIGLSKPELDQLTAWNQTASQTMGDESIHALFEMQVRATPDAVALVVDGGENGEHQEVTYSQLNQKANGLAWQLQEQGIGCDDVVGVFADRGIELVTGLLGILKAGAAYLPLDTTTPDEQLAWLMADAGVGAVLTQAGHADCLKGPAPVLLLEAAEACPSGPAVDVTAKNLAYIIYTSGSTGKPKGVMLHHGGALNLISSIIGDYQVGAGDRQLQQTSITFDVSFGEIFPVLCAGGASVIVRGREMLEPSAFHALLVRQEITIFGGTPSLLTHFNQPGALPKSVRLILSGGEALNTSHINHLLEQAVVTNGYGPTEITVCATAAACDGSRERPAIGRPIMNAGVHMLDSHGFSVPMGAPGELCISGAGLARGYLGDPVRTAEKFVPNPFADSQAAGSRLYRSGDLARYLADGQIHFLGRMDHQVKLRGFRIEPGEIENVLTNHDAVDEALVLVREDRPGDKRLVGYVAGGSDLDPEELRAYLSGKLADYMVPSVLMVMAQFPHTSAGKVDRRALPVPELVDSDSYAPARNPVEARLVAIWEELLELSRVGIHDDFFQLGGHSLLCIRLVGELKRVFPDRPLVLVDIFRAPTVAGLAELLRKPASAATLVPLNTSGDRHPWFIVHPVGGEVHWYHELAENIPAHPIYGIQSPGLFDPDLIVENLEEMAANYVAAIREVQPQGPYFLAGWSIGGSIALEMAQQLTRDHQAVDRLVLIDAVNQSAGTDKQLREFALVEFINELTPVNDERVLNWAEQLTDMPADQHIPWLVEQLSDSGMLPAGTDVGYLEQKFRVYFNNRKAASGYQPEPYPYPLFLVRATETVKVMGSDRKFARTYGWQRYGMSHLELFTIDANHYNLFKGERSKALATLFQSDLPDADIAFRQLDSYIYLQALLDDPKINSVLQSSIGILESVFPNRIRGYHLMGSLADGDTVKASDVDLLIVFKDTFIGDEEETLQRIANHLAPMVPFPMDFNPTDESRLFRFQSPNLRKVLTIYGELKNEQPEVKDIEHHRRRFIYFSMGLYIFNSRQSPDYLHFPLEHIDAEDPYFGCTEPDEKDPSILKTKRLIYLVMQPAMAVISNLTKTYIVNKRHAPQSWRELINNEWNDYIETVLDKVRGEWNYLVPEDPEDLALFKQLCERSLEFDNYCMEIFRDIMIEDLDNTSASVIPLTMTEMSQYLGLNEMMIEEEVAAGRVEKVHRYGEDVYIIPGLYRILAVLHLGKVIYPGDEIRERLLKLREEDWPFLRYYCDLSLRRIGQARAAEKNRD